MTVEEIRAVFPQLKRMVHGHPLIYLDSAAASLKPQSVIDRLTCYYTNEACNVHRGAHTLGDQATEFFEEARQMGQKFLNARSADEIIFTSGTTGSLNIVANSLAEQLQPGDEVLVTQMEHHSNIVPWQMVCQRRNCTLSWLEVGSSGTLKDFKEKITSRTKVFAFTGVSHVTGRLNEVASMSKYCRERNILTVVDAAQMAAHYPLNVMAWGCDFLALSGHKIFGPTGIGILYGRKEVLDTLTPGLGGGGMIENVTMRGSTYLKAPHGWEAGTPHIAGAIGLSHGIQFLQSLGWEELQKREHALFAQLYEQLSLLPRVRLIGADKAYPASIISFIIEGVHHQDIGALLDPNGIAVRVGRHCAQPFMEHFGIIGTVRVSFSVFNTSSEITRFVESLQNALDILE